MLAEIAMLDGQRVPPPARSGSFSKPSSLAERIQRDPPPPGVRRFYNTAFKMPERPRRGD